MKVKLIEGRKFWKFGDFTIVEGEEKECDPEVVKQSMGYLVPVQTKKPSKKKEAEKDERTE